MYVSDVLKVTVRRGPSTEYKVIAVAESGELLEILEESEDWSLARLQNGKEGYVMTRYLTAEPTHKILYEQLQVKQKALAERASALSEENARLKEENNQLKSALSSTEKSLNKVEGDFQELKAGSAEYLTLKTDFKKVSEQLSEQTQKADRLDKELSKVELNQYIKWFLAGSGVLLVGFIVGFSARRQRRRPSLL
jgi:SH3 domain protein